MSPLVEQHLVSLGGREGGRETGREGGMKGEREDEDNGKRHVKGCGVPHEFLPTPPVSSLNSVFQS